MTFANIQLPSNLVLEPMFAELVNKLALDMPSFTFTTKGMEANEINYQTSETSMSDRSIKAPEGFQFLTKLKVYKGPELLGELFLDRRYGRSTGNSTVYSIRSWRIDNQRGNANTSTTNKLTGAARLAKKHFVPQNMVEIMDKATSSLQQGMFTAIRDLSRPILHNQLGPNQLLMQRFLYQFMNGETDPEGADVIRQHFTSDKYHKAMSECMLAEKMEKKPYAVAVHHNNAFLVKPSNSEMEYKAFDELPEYMQNAIGVLQLMEDYELVDDIGFRLNDTNFLILEK
jgi:hypothetical protein